MAVSPSTVDGAFGASTALLGRSHICQQVLVSVQRKKTTKSKKRGSGEKEGNAGRPREVQR